MSLYRRPFIHLADLDVSDPADANSIITAHRRRFLVPIEEPLVLVTQVQRSGGTLITQLLDGHSGLHVHPSELHIGKPKWSWPTIEPTAPPTTLFHLLREKRIREHAQFGYHKLSPAELARNRNHDDLRLPFIFLESLQEQLFLALLERKPPRVAREVLDAYATSYFNAWIDYAGLYRQRPDFWVAFIPRFLWQTDNASRFFTDYPDGRLVVPVRDPISWYASARGHTVEYEDLDHALGVWLSCNDNAIVAKERFPDQVVFVEFEKLVTQPRRTLTALLGRLTLALEAANLEPTFNGMPVPSGSSFGAKLGIDHSTLDRSAHVPPAMRAVIRKRTDELYATVKKHADGIYDTAFPQKAM